MKKFKIKFSEEKISIKTSSPFIIRDVCKHCGSCPVYYYRTASKEIFSNIKDFNTNNKYYNTYSVFNNNVPKFLLTQEFVQHNYLNIICYDVGERSFGIKKFKTRDTIKDSFCPIEFASCECGKTQWGFREQTTKHKIEALHKSSRVKYNKTLKY